MKVRGTKTYTQYQLDKIIDSIETNFEKQWQERVEEITEATFENTKVDMFAQFSAVAMATLQWYNNFTDEQLHEFYSNCISVMQMMKTTPLGKDISPSAIIESIKENMGIDLDKSMSENL